MPRKGGHWSAMERDFVKGYVATGNAAFAAEKAGYRHSLNVGSMMLAKPVIAAEIQRQQIARMSNELLPMALDHIESVLAPGSIASVRDKTIAAKIVIDKTTGIHDAGEVKEPHEMTAGELQERINRLRLEASNRAKVIDVAHTVPNVFS